MPLLSPHARPNEPRAPVTKMLPAMENSLLLFSLTYHTLADALLIGFWPPGSGREHPFLATPRNQCVGEQKRWRDRITPSQQLSEEGLRARSTRRFWSLFSDTCGPIQKQELQFPASPHLHNGFTSHRKGEERLLNTCQVPGTARNAGNSNRNKEREPLPSGSCPSKGIQKEVEREEEKVCSIQKPSKIPHFLKPSIIPGCFHATL
ncbi:uncharacterized protein LOC130454756 isoform X2 [Monodelphis domestica]|uniref:uncharacterized protein LOC130454756 isoform X2 n=1 Tax=Monodelphis domestica TaxID=13616 RepID=UPI0024E1D57F|nr:uncharacterized protein LOC130454756 isoform X2 [Monodelphis domestica]